MAGQTNTELLKMILERQMDHGEQLAAINKTIHNGMSHQIHETAETVQVVARDLQEYKASHFTNCPYIKSEEAKKQRIRAVPLRFWWFLTGAFGAGVAGTTFYINLSRIIGG